MERERENETEIERDGERMDGNGKEEDVMYTFDFVYNRKMLTSSMKSFAVCASVRFRVLTAH